MRLKVAGRVRWALAMALALALPLGSGCDGRKQSPAQVTIGEMTWSVELATTEQQRYRGLSGRRELAEDEGMLFVYPREQTLDFCMRGCVIPLDIAFIDGQLRVVSVQTMAVEPDLAGRVSYRSGAAAQYALEVTAGALERAGVEVGDKVLLSGNIPSPTKAARRP